MNEFKVGDLVTVTTNLTQYQMQDILGFVTSVHKSDHHFRGRPSITVTYLKPTFCVSRWRTDQTFLFPYYSVEHASRPEARTKD